MVNAGQFKKSAKKFTDYAGRLSGSGPNDFYQSLSMFLRFLEEDKSLYVIHEQLLNMPRVDFNSWYVQRMYSGGSHSGSKELTFPPKEEERMAVMYELLRRIDSKKIDLLNFCSAFFVTPSSSFDSKIRVFNHVISERFVRDLTYRIDDISDDLPPDPNALVPPSMIQIINNANNVVQQLANGDNIAQNAKIESDSKIEKLFEELIDSLKSNIQDEKDLVNSLEVVDAAKSNLLSISPKVSVIKSLLGTLPHVGNVLTIASAIVSML